MSEKIEVGADAIVMDSKDHVATSLRMMSAGEKIVYRVDNQLIEMLLLEDIPFGHKIATCDLPEGTEVRKYGEVIGRASISISAGTHVHVHNIEGIRGRGDQPKKETSI